MSAAPLDLTGRVRVLVTGATGTIGRRVVSVFPGARILSRDPARAEALGVDARAWDGRSAIEVDAFRDIGAIVHLAGEPVAGTRWSANKKRAIRDSRVLGTRALVDSLRRATTRPRVLVCASAVGIYGDRGEEALDEHASPGSGFLADVCTAWEAEANAATELGVRVVSMRFGVVLDRRGGALPMMAAPFRFGAGGPLGSGQQWVPWIHAEDVVRLIAHAIDRDDVEGPVNAVAPAPVRNAELASAIGHALSRPSLLRVPAFALRATLGEAADVVLHSQHVSPLVAWRTGFRFEFTSVEDALADLLAAAPRNKVHDVHAT